MGELLPKPEDIEAQCREFLRTWGVESLINDIQVIFSGRMQTSLGVADIRRKRIRINKKLLQCELPLFREVLCHELAHVVIFEYHGRTAKPHGKEWKQLMRIAGFEPRARMPTTGLPDALKPVYYDHTCTVCQASRKAARKMTRWRCGACLASGLSGELLIERSVL